MPLTPGLLRRPSGNWWEGMDFGVFPGAKGFGTDSAAGRGGTLLRVTNLNDSGAGSLRAALTASGARTVIFDVSGTVILADDITVSNGSLTIAFQTAPSPGFTMRKGGLFINAADVLVQHMRSRIGNESGGSDPTARDCIRVSGSSNRVVLDHCSFSWAVDENGGTSTAGTRQNISLIDSIVSEGLSIAGHPETEHSKGWLIGQDTGDICVIRTIFAHNTDRNPYIKENVPYVVCNILSYDHGQQYSVQIRSQTIPVSRGSVVGCVFIDGVDTDAGVPIQIHDSSQATTRVYLSDNSANRNAPPADPWSSTVVEEGVAVVHESSAPVWPTGLVAMANNLVEAYLRANAGARPLDPDSVDTRIKDDIRDGTGSIIDNPSEVGGWPTLAENTRVLSVPGNHADILASGYSVLEEQVLFPATEEVQPV